MGEGPVVKIASDVTSCLLCGDTGWKPLGNGRERRVTRCDCRLQARSGSLLESARIPKRYESCELSNFITEFPDLPAGDQHDTSLVKARFLAGRFVEEYTPGCRGLIFLGGNGTGKTHLAVGIVHELMRSKGVPCLFVDFRELLREIRHSYDPSTQTTEFDVLSPVFEIPVLLLDDLGAFTTTAWERDTISYIFNKRYSDERTTIVTTYLSDKPSPIGETSDSPTPFSRSGRTLDEARAALRERTLGERIGDQMRARLHEMCRRIEIQAGDYRERPRGR